VLSGGKRKSVTCVREMHKERVRGSINGLNCWDKKAKGYASEVGGEKQSRADAVEKKRGREQSRESAPRGHLWLGKGRRSIFMRGRQPDKKEDIRVRARKGTPKEEDNV